MPIKALLYTVAALGCGIGAFAVGSMERSRMDIRKQGTRYVSDAELRYGPELGFVFMLGSFGFVALVGAVREFFRRAHRRPVS